jgi:hypothetical protein
MTPTILVKDGAPAMVIGTPGGSQNIVDRCFNFNDPLLCPLITFGANQSLSEIRNVNLNLQWLRTSGLDIETAYRLPLSRISELPGTLNFRLLASRTYELATNLFGVVTDRAGETGGAGGSPTWLATLNSGYSNGPFTGTLTTRYIRGGKLNATYYEPGQTPPVPAANSINDNHVGGIVYFNLNGSWNLGGRAGMELFADRLSRGANWDALKLFLQEWASEQSVAEVYAAAQQRRIPFAPVSTMGDLLASPHLKARGFFATLDVPGARVTVPGAPYQLSATPWAIRRSAPRLGEHTAEVLREVGLDAGTAEDATPS